MCVSFETVSISHSCGGKGKILVVTSDSRIVVGTFLGHDQVQNLILQDAVERVYSKDADVEEEPLGLYLLRGDNLCMISEFDSDKLNDNRVRVPKPLPPVKQVEF